MTSPEAADLPLHTWTSHRFPVSLPPGHRFPIAKYEPLLSRLRERGLVRDEHLHFSEPAPVEWLTRAHDDDYVERALRGTMPADEVRRLGLPWSPELATRARAAVWGTVMASFAALEHGVAGNLAGGSHHAHRGHAAAYCLFHDIAVAIALLRSRGHAARPLVVDLDVHQGDGTAAMFEHDDSVYTLSLHARSNYPARKARSTRDVELEDGAGDDAYLAALDAHLPEAFAAHRPDFVWYQAGVDGLAEDRLGRLALTHAGLAARDARVFAACEAHGVPVTVTLGGGYSEPLEASIEAHAGVWREARRARDRRGARRSATPPDGGTVGTM